MLKILETPKSIAILAGVLCYLIAYGILVGFPSLLTDADEPKVVGEDGVPRDVPPYTPHQQAGRDVYGVQVCWHCHSQFIRPVNDEDLRWGPVSPDRRVRAGTSRTSSARDARAPTSTARAACAPTTGTTRTSTTRGTRSRTRSCPASRGSSRTSTARRRSARPWRSSTRTATAWSRRRSATRAATPPASVAAEVARYRSLASSQDPFTKLDKRGVMGPGDQSVDSMWWVGAPDSGDGLLTDYDAAPAQDARAAPTSSRTSSGSGTTIGKWRRPLYAPTPPRVSPFDDVDAAPAPHERHARLRLPARRPGSRSRPPTSSPRSTRRTPRPGTRATRSTRCASPRAASSSRSTARAATAPRAAATAPRRSSC